MSVCHFVRFPPGRVSGGAPFPDVEGGIEKSYISQLQAKHRPSEGMNQ